jgi:chromosomal replication initiator protein
MTTAQHVRPSLAFAAQAWGVSVEALTAEGRSQSVADARALAMWIVRRTFGYSYPELGRIFGRHHSTCITAVQKVERALRTGRPPRLAEIARSVEVSK